MAVAYDEDYAEEVYAQFRRDMAMPRNERGLFGRSARKVSRADCRSDDLATALAEMGGED